MMRHNMLRQLSAMPVWDIVIIGGGATGLGCAVDAASRGYATLLVEQHDFAKGTSSRSTKLVHGGVRYLAQGNIKLVREALRERAFLLRNAPHLTAAMAFVVPAYSWWSLWFYTLGLTLYDWLSGKLSLGKTKRLNRRQTKEHLPGINDKNLKGGILYYDGQFDDARLAIDLATTAARHGATLINYCSAVSFAKHNNRISGVVLRDEINGQTYTVKAKSVVNATGVFADAVMQMDEPGKEHLIAPSQGIHMVVDQHFFPGRNALMIPKTDDGRVLFAVPWHNKVLLGTTDTPIGQVEAEPKPLDEELQFILHHANRYLSQTISWQDVSSVFAGLRPLIKQTGAAATAMLSRDHTIVVSDSGLITVSGGKWTTYRKMAEDVVNKAGTLAQLSPKACLTRQLPIQSACAKGGSHAPFLHPQFEYSEADIACFVQHEMAMTVEDILARRTRILFLDAAIAMTVAAPVARFMASLLQHGEEWIATQLSSFEALAKQYIVATREEP